MQQNLNNIIDQKIETLERNLKPVEDYSIILTDFGVEYKYAGLYLHVGEVNQVQGWLLHISVVRSQIPMVMSILVPFLHEENIAYKIARDKETARNILDGGLGTSQVGKVVTVYPETEEQALWLAKEMVSLTKPYKGPAVLTDVHLGGLVYTRYGSFEQIIMSDAEGNENKYLYSSDGELIKDPESIPFQLPADIQWPFGELATPTVVPRKKIIKQKYRPITNLKSDPRGNVIKALYLDGPFKIKWCVIKEGIKNMWSDDHGRDIPDRLEWQKELHDLLQGKVPLARVLDFFTEHENTYLVLEFVKGKSLHDRLSEMNLSCNLWVHWSLENKLIALDYLLQLIVLIRLLHDQGIVHRDITPVNFMVDKNNRLLLIDIELSYSLKTQKPQPAFILGTNGFMSPQQMDMQTPTLEEDIYGIGATMVNIFADLAPLAFIYQSSERLQQNLSFFIENSQLASIITSCLDLEPEKRPSLAAIEGKIEQYRDQLRSEKSFMRELAPVQAPDAGTLARLIQTSIQGLVNYPTLLDGNGLWLSSMSSDDHIQGKQNKQFGLSGSFGEGIAGILYLIAYAKRNGFNTEICQEAYDKGWRFIQNQFLDILPRIPPGFYAGGAGLSLALCEGMLANLIETTEENKLLLRQCLELPHIGLDLAVGASGQGMALIHCKSLLTADYFQTLHQQHINAVLNGQKEKGYWMSFKNKLGKRTYAFSFLYGNTGIIYFLLNSLMNYEDQYMKDTIDLSLKRLITLEKYVRSVLKKEGVREILFGNSTILDGFMGSVLVFIKAYEIFRKPVFQQLAEELLALLSPNIVHDNFSLKNGLAGLGEIYLLAYQTFNAEEWRLRAGWIAQFFIHTSVSEVDGFSYWQGNNTAMPTAELMTGNSGIIYFLIEYFKVVNHDN